MPLVGLQESCSVTDAPQYSCHCAQAVPSKLLLRVLQRSTCHLQTSWTQLRWWSAGGFF